MKLTIHKLSTRGSAPGRGPSAAAMVDEVARVQLALELQAQLGPSLDRFPPVVRLKQLKISLKIDAYELSRAKLASAWARAFAVALHQSLESSANNSADRLRSFSSSVAYTASMLHHIANRGVAPCWEFPEMQRLCGLLPDEAALQLLLKEPERIADVIAELYREGWLGTVLGLWNELSMERLIQAFAVVSPEAGGLSLAMLVELGHAASAAGGLEAGWPLADRRQAVWLWVRLRCRLPLRSLHDALRLLLTLLDNPALLLDRQSSLSAKGVRLPPWCARLVSEIVSLHAACPAGVPEALDLFAVLDKLRPLTPSSAKPIPIRDVSSRWIASDCTGILLLLSTVRRLDLWRFAFAPEFASFGGPRALSFLLAGIGMTLLKRGSRYEPGESNFLLDPAIALFAGAAEELDRIGMRQFFAATYPSSIADFVDASTWSEVLELGATELAAAFAGQVRGFRAASREAVVKQFLRIPGRILVEEERLLVVVERTPLAVALHLSGMDAPLHRVEWLANRRVEFILEGL